ncbi:MAG: hypothetical protein WCB94_11075 [Terriglobales bacterium]
MKRLAAFFLLAALSVVCAMPVQAQNTTTNENMHRARQAAKQPRKAMKKLSKQQRKAMKKSGKPQRKTNKRSNRRAG